MRRKQLTKKEKIALINAVEQAIQELEEAGEKVDFPAVARKLNIARSTLYRNTTVRHIITSAREKRRLSANTLFKLQEDVEDLKNRVSYLEELVSKNHCLNSGSSPPHNN